MKTDDITACTVVQAAFVKVNSQSNGKGQILTPWSSETPERSSMKLGIYNRVAGMPTHANPCGAAIYTSYDVFPPKDVPFGVSLILLPILRVKSPKTPILGRE